MLQTTTFPERLKHCVQQVGTQNEFLEKVSLSRSQLFRYLDGETYPTLDKLCNFSNASNVDLGWLTTGKGNPCKTENQSLSFSYELMEHVIKAVEDALMEYQGPALTPTQKSVIIPLIQAEMELEKELGFNEGILDSADIPRILDYTRSMRKNNMLSAYKKTSFKLHENEEPTSDLQDLGTFTNIICQSTIDYFSSDTGERYCQRTDGIVNEYTRKFMFHIMESMFKQIRKNDIKMLDIGCGSGRYMEYIHNNYSDRISVQGIEPSDMPLESCYEKERMGNLPKSSVQKADARKLPFEDNSFDFLMSKAMLQWLPYFKALPIGANKVFSEASRVLNSGGCFYFDMRHGSGHREFLPFNQTYSKADVQKLAEDHGFKILWIHCDSDPYFEDLANDFSYTHPKYSDFISVFAVKL